MKEILADCTGGAGSGRYKRFSVECAKAGLGGAPGRGRGVLCILAGQPNDKHFTYLTSRGQQFRDGFTYVLEDQELIVVTFFGRGSITMEVNQTLTAFQNQLFGGSFASQSSQIMFENDRRLNAV